ncbi:MAG TPA: PadR family transcriptional regulator [Firmicutes bacterium]|nr:PadR family transcriptional regulator [Bacillota bacterium]
MESKEPLSGLLLELRRGTVVLSVLSQLGQPMYGYHLVRILSEGGVPIEANTLYPLLRRLESQGLLQSVWETGGAKPRKYYVITKEGRAVYGELRAHWAELVQRVNALLESAPAEKKKEEIDDANA